MSHLGLDAWHSRIDACALQDELLLVVGAYLGEWRPQDIDRLPIRLTAPVPSIADLQQRAVELMRAEANFRGSTGDWTLLGELTVVITAAAVRARSLELEQARSLKDVTQETKSKAPLGIKGRKAID